MKTILEDISKFVVTKLLEVPAGAQDVRRSRLTSKYSLSLTGHGPGIVIPDAEIESFRFSV